MPMKKTKLIDSTWKDTLKFLAGTLKKKEAVTLIKELSLVTLNPQSQDYRQSLDFIVQCAWENKHTHHLVSETIGNLKPSGLFSTLRKTARYWGLSTMLFGSLLLAGGFYYSTEQSRKDEEARIVQKAKLLSRGRKECEEIKYSSNLIECFRYYTYEGDTIKEQGYKEGFRLGFRGQYEVREKLVWQLKPNECGEVYHAGGGVVIITLGPNHYWSFEYDTNEEANNAVDILGEFCQKEIKADEEKNYPDIKTSDQDDSLEILLASAREDCHKIAYSTEIIECLKEYLIDEEGKILESDFPDYRPLPPGVHDGMERDDGFDNADRLVWKIQDQECQRVYDAGVGVVIMEMKDGRVWEFKYKDYNSYNHNNDEDKIKIKKIVKGLQDFCQDKKEI